MSGQFWRRSGFFSLVVKKALGLRTRILCGHTLHGIFIFLALTFQEASKRAKKSQSS